MLVELALVKEIIDRYGVNVHHMAGTANPGDAYTKFSPNEVTSECVDFSKSTVGTTDLYVPKLEKHQKENTRNNDSELNPDKN
jgi:hypothetical protein